MPNKASVKWAVLDVYVLIEAVFAVILAFQEPPFQRITTTTTARCKRKVLFYCMLAPHPIQRKTVQSKTKLLSELPGLHLNALLDADIIVCSHASRGLHLV